MDIDILCKVVDNYGDIGFVYRLARSLSERPDPPRLRLVVDDLASFALLEPAVEQRAARQVVRGWEVFAWFGGPGGTAEASAAFAAKRPRIVLECFACGRPDWLEAILFDPSSEEKCLVVDVEHLTAEAFAEDFHRMPSLTRSPVVKKAMFFPGFTAATGGLVVDESFARSRRRVSSDDGRAALRREFLERLEARGTAVDPAAAGEGAADRFWICVFAYERDYSRIVADLAAFQELAVAGGAPPLLVFAASGRSQGCLASAWSAAGEPFSLVVAPFLPQETWDELLLACDFSVIRGEDSWARAALSGRPFLWQAYPQEGRHQLVKVAAFLDRLRLFFPAASGADGVATVAFPVLEELCTAFNDRDGDRTDLSGREALLPALTRYSELLPGFRAFSESLAQAPDLASSLLTFLREIV